MVYRSVLRLGARLGRTLWLASLLGTGACFDSDEVPQASESTSTGAATTSTSTTATTGAASTSESGDPPPITCRDAIHCIRDCALDIALGGKIEPDLSCFLECEESLTVPEATQLLRLGNCASDACADLGYCDPESGTTDAGTTDTGVASSGSSDSSTGTTTSDEAGATGEFEVCVDLGTSSQLGGCLSCVFCLMNESTPTQCIDFHAECD